MTSAGHKQQSLCYECKNEYLMGSAYCIGHHACGVFKNTTSLPNEILVMSKTCYNY